MSEIVVARMPLRAITARAALSIAAWVWRPRAVGSGVRGLTVTDFLTPRARDRQGH